MGTKTKQELIEWIGIYTENMVLINQWIDEHEENHPGYTQAEMRRATIKISLRDWQWELHLLTRDNGAIDPQTQQALQWLPEWGLKP